MVWLRDFDLTYCLQYIKYVFLQMGELTFWYYTMCKICFQCELFPVFQDAGRVSTVGGRQRACRLGAPYHQERV